MTTPTLLQINASIFGDKGNSSTLVASYVAAWRAAHPDGQVVTRDLTANPLPHLDLARFTAFGTPAADRTPEQAAYVAESDVLIDELKAADVIVLGLPMYNFGVPSQLKSYIDYIARAGITFRYTAAGPEGLLGGRRMVVMAARGGIYQGTPNDSQTAYVQTLFGFLGITNIEFVYAEGIAYSAEHRSKALADAQAAIEKLAV